MAIRGSIPQEQVLIRNTMAFEFHHRRFVHRQDTDLAGIIHFTNYFRYMEEAETAFHRSLGIHPLPLGDPGVFRRRVAASCDFRRPVSFGDELDVHIWVRQKGASSIEYEFSFQCESQEVAHGRLAIVCVEKGEGGALRPAPVPAALDQALEVAPFAASEK